jgi:UDP-3-O-[3-hydroxymyristoyl] glucosamine N-acyltransferase
METGVNDYHEGKRSFSLGELGRLLDAEVQGDPDLHVSGIGALESAAPGQLSFLVGSRYRHLVSECKASALIVSPEFRDLSFTLLIVKDPYLAFAKAARLFLPDLDNDAGIHPTAFIGEGVLFGEGVSAGPFAHVGNNSQIGAGSKIGSGAYIGKEVRIGDMCVIHPRATVADRCVIGNRVIIHSGAVIGEDGYGYAQDEQGRHVKIPQIGIVQIDDDVEIGSNATIDRATFGRTWIKRGVKIDNLVMIAHNVVVGEDSLLVAQVGISGSTRIGDHVALGGQAGIAGHLEIGDRTKIAAKAGIHHSIKSDQLIIGSPGIPKEEFLRNLINVQRLPRLKEALKRLGDRVQMLEEALKKDDGHNSD